MTSAQDVLPACDMVGSCRYLRDLSRLEQLIGCDPTAKFYERVANRCSQGGCWALLLHLREIASPHAARRSRFPLKATRAAPKAKVSKAKGPAAEVIPFVRSDVADVVTDSEGNFVERRGLKVGSLDPTEPLGYMYDYWRWLRSMTECQLSNIDTMHLMRAGIVGALHVINVESNDPDDFRFELAGFRIPLERHEKPRHFGYPLYVDSVLRDYNTTRLTAAPRLQHVRTQLDSAYHNYRRLILPLFDKRRRVCRLLVAVESEPGNDITVRRR
jgi:hypothetical protein